MSSKPVYVPPHKRKRLHGAFTGGFSAGYFNTVGTKDGWKPREDARVTQTTHDFMDDQDHNEWGGPTSVKEEFASSEPKKISTRMQALSTSMDWIEAPRNVGTRLMRILGWREGSTAYVPHEQSMPPGAGGEAKKEDSLEAAVLSQKRLRKIQLQQTRVRMPPPKLDACGLGFDAYRDAPEFQAHREKRRREARQRAIAATAGSKSSNAYRMSSLKRDDNDNDNNDVAQPQQQLVTKTITEADNDPYLSYETMMDFVGTKTTGGFAIREDDDDVYDEKPLPKNVSALQVDKDQYNTEIFEHESDDEKIESKGQSVGGILSSWATGQASTTTDRGITSDGRPPLPGFSLGGAIAQKEIKRYAGPELPVNYTLKRHQFREDEHPASFQKMAQQEKIEQRRQEPIVRTNSAMADVTFAGLQEAMKNRFTTASAPSITQEATPTPVGLHRPAPAMKADESKIEIQKSGKKAIEIKRTFLLFHPDQLVCKRLGVTQPTHSKSVAQIPKRSTEAAFFEDQVVKQAAAAKFAAPAAKATTELILYDDGLVEPKETDSRPAINVYKSIFETMSESEPDDVEEGNQAGMPESDIVLNEDEKQIVPIASNALISIKDQDFETNENKRGDESRLTKRFKRKKRKRRRRRNPSVSSSETDLDAPDSEDEYMNSRRTEKKKRKHRKQASRSPSSESDSDALSSDDGGRRQRRKDRKRRKHKKEKESRKSSTRHHET